MGKITLWAALLAAAIGGAVVVYAVAQGTMSGTEGTAATETKAHPPEAMACPVCSMMAGDKKYHEEMMVKAGITQEMMRLCHGLGNAPLDRDNPAVLLGMVEDLNLTKDQKKQLKEIDKEAREKALKVLTADQVKLVENLPGGPTTLMEMRHEMHKKMMKEMKKEGKDRGVYCCPMMMKMKEGAETKESGEMKEMKHKHMKESTEKPKE
jgi:hypothetical protein